MYRIDNIIKNNVLKLYYGEDVSVIDLENLSYAVLNMPNINEDLELAILLQISMIKNDISDMPNTLKLLASISRKYVNLYKEDILRSNQFSDLFYDIILDGGED